MKAFIAAAIIVLSSASAFAAQLPSMIQLRVYQDRHYVNDITGLPLSKSEILSNHSTVYDFANIAEVDPRDSTVVQLFRVYPRVQKTFVGSVNFLYAQQAQNFLRALASGSVKVLGFPAPPTEGNLFGDAEEVIVRRR